MLEKIATQIDDLDEISQAKILSALFDRFESKPLDELRELEIDYIYAPEFD